MKKLLLTTLSLFCALSLQAAQQQPQEVSFKNKQNLTLRGSFWHAPSDSVIIMVHGAGNNRNANGMFPLLADTFQKQGYNILTFDMAGHGKSDNVTFDLPQVEDDVTAAISFCKKKFKNILLVGHSLGAYGCLKAATPEIQTIILLGGMVGPVHFTWEQFCTPQEITEMEKVGYATLHDPHPGPRLLQQWKQEFCQHVATINQKDLMASVTCPVLFIHGSKDIFPELEENAHKALMYLKPESKITIIPDASHEFMEHIPQVTKEISGWLKEKAPITYHP